MKSSLSEAGLSKLVTSPFGLAPIISHTVLDGKYNIAAGTPIGDSNRNVKYLGVGLGGTISPTSYLDGSLRNRKVGNIDLYNTIPMVIVDQADDLSPADQLLYRARLETYLDGVPKVFYYLLDIQEAIADANSSLTLRVADMDNTEIDPTTTSEIPNKNNMLYYNANTSIFVILNPSVNARLKDAVTTLYPGNTNKVITEVGLYTGDEVDIDGRTEVNNLQLYLSSSQIVTLSASSVTPITIKLDVGLS